MKNVQAEARHHDDIERRQLDRLAHAVLDRPATELLSISRHNPALVDEWIVEIQSRRDEVEVERRALETALARLKAYATRGEAGEA